MKKEGRKKMTQKLARIHRGQKGITGLETAIILIAFVVVAAVFAYTALSAGLFSTQKSQEAVYQGLEEAQSTLEPRGNVVAYKGDDTVKVGKVEFTVTNAVKGEPIDLTPPYALVSGNLTTSGLSNPAHVAYSDESVTITECAWTLSWNGKNDADYLLETDEQAVITVWLHHYDGSSWTAGASPPYLGSDTVDTYHTFTLEVKPASGAVLVVERTTPGYLDTVMDLH